MPRLVVEQGKDSGAEVLVVGALTVGRDTSCGLTLHDRQASRQHCQFDAEGEALRVKDLGSRNGILVNGNKVAEADLKVGDRVAIGGSVLRVAEGALGAWSGKTVGGYRFLDKIGEGGMGEVYRAEQLSMKRFVAAKVLSAKLNEDPRYVERLLKEARAAAQLNHPGLIQVHDVLQAPEVTFFSMELVQGKTLREHLRRGPLSLTEVLAMARGVLEALKYAHAKGIVHHDVKPENVMLSEDGRIKLADLGIAQPSGAKLQDGATGKRILVGTPQYMPPDQVTAERVDPRFDLYALGATCYHALGGRPPYKGTGPEDIVRQLRTGPPPPLASLAATLPPEVIAFVERLMARDPEARTPSADQALRDLSALQAQYGEGDRGGAATTTGSKTGGVPTPAHGDAKAAWPRQLALATVGILLLAGILVGSRAVARRYLPAPSPAKPVPAPAVPPRPSPDQAAALLAQGEDARNKGNVDAAEKAFQAYLDLNLFDDQHLPGRAKAREGLEWVAQEKMRQHDDAAWAALLSSLEGQDVSQDQRAERLKTFLDANPASLHAPDARERLDRIARDRAAAAMARLSQAADETLENARRLAAGEKPDPPRFNAALAALRAFRKAHADLPADKASEMTALEGDLAKRRQSLWEETLRQSKDQEAKNRFGPARRVLEALAAIPDEGWDEAVRIPLANLDRAQEDYAGKAFPDAERKLASFDLKAAEDAYAEAAQALADTPLAPRAAACLDRARALSALHQAVLEQIAHPAHGQYPLQVKAGSGRIESATPEVITVSLDGSGVKTTIAWKELAPLACFAVYRHYLDTRQPQSRFQLFAFCWDRGLWKEAADEAEKGKEVLAQHPEMAEQFASEDPRGPRP